MGPTRSGCGFFEPIYGESVFGLCLVCWNNLETEHVLLAGVLLLGVEVNLFGIAIDKRKRYAQ